MPKIISFMTEKLTKKDILHAVEKSGYLMEQEIATLLESLGFYVQTNWPFKDVEEGKSREIDIHAFKRVAGSTGSLTIDAVLLCECKNNTNPFVFISRKKSAVDRAYAPMEYCFPRLAYNQKFEKDGTTYYREIPAFRYLGLDKGHYYFQQPEKAVQFCKIVRHGSYWVAQHGGLYDSVFYPLAKAVQALREYHRQYTTSISLFFPMVVLNGEMYLIDSTTASPALTESSHVTFVRELQSEKVEGHFMIEFVRKSAIKDFLQLKVTPFLEQVARVVEDNRDLLLRH